MRARLIIPITWRSQRTALLAAAAYRAGRQRGVALACSTVDLLSDELRVARAEIARLERERAEHSRLRKLFTARLRRRADDMPEPEQPPTRRVLH